MPSHPDRVRESYRHLCARCLINKAMINQILCGKCAFELHEQIANQSISNYDKNGPPELD